MQRVNSNSSQVSQSNQVASRSVKGLSRFLAGMETKKTPSLYTAYERYGTKALTPLELNGHQGSIKVLILSEYALLSLYISSFFV